MGAAARAVGATNWPSIGELDIMEDVNALSEVSHTFHCGVDPGGPCNETTGLGSGLLGCGGCQTGYHTYSVIVDRTNTSAEQLRFYTDGALQLTINENQVPVATWQAAVDHGFFMILNVAMGGAYPNAICGCGSPSSATSSGAGMSVDYVAVYETGSGATTTPTTTPPTTAPPSTDPAEHRASDDPPPGGQQCTTTATSDISADCFSTSQGSAPISAAGDTNPAGVDGNQVAQLSNGTWLEYPGVNFGTGSSQFDARAASGARRRSQRCGERGSRQPGQRADRQLRDLQHGRLDQLAHHPGEHHHDDRNAQRLPGVPVRRRRQPAVRQPALLQLPRPMIEH